MKDKLNINISGAKGIFDGDMDIKEKHRAQAFFKGLMSLTRKYKVVLLEARKEQDRVRYVVQACTILGDEE